MRRWDLSTWFGIPIAEKPFVLQGTTRDSLQFHPDDLSPKIKVAGVVVSL
jgi:hypothetical protein